MDRKQIEREVRAALKDPKRHKRTITHYYPYTGVSLWMKSANWYSNHQVVKCAPEDEYNERIGYELALDRCIHDIVDQIMAEQKPPTPERKQAMLVKSRAMLVKSRGNDRHLSVWCDDDLIETIRSLPFVNSCLFTTNPRLVCIDPRYDIPECQAAIEALGRES